jgi:glycosyltransferase involved in cell wall biosynthesis
MLKISIITVCFNSATTISDTIKSVASQKYKNKEHVIVDGASKDATMDIVRSSSSVTRYVSEPDKGIYDAMNKGISMVTGDIVGTLNADDFYADDNVLTEVARVFDNPEVDACYADLVYVDQSDTSRISRYWKSRPFRVGLFKHGWMPAHPTFFVRKHLYEELGDFDLDYKLQSDFELTMRFLEIYRIKAVYIPRIMVKMRIGGASNQSIRNIMSGNLEAYKACKKNHLSISPIFNILKIFSRIPQFFMRPRDY